MLALARMVLLERIREPKELLWNLTLRELRGKYRRSFLGWTWSLLNPLSLVLIYSFIFSVIFGAVAPTGTPSGAKNYALFLLCGLLPWTFFSLTTNLGMSVLLNNGGLVKKASFTRQILVYAQSCFSIVQSSIEMSLLTVFSLVAGVSAVPRLPLVLLYMIILGVFSTGIGLALSVSVVYFRDITYLWTIFLQVYFFFTPIFYDAKMLDGKAPDAVLFLLRWNPMNQFVAAFRSMLYDGSWPTLSGFIVVVIASAVSLSAGHFIFKKLNKRVAEEI